LSGQKALQNKKSEENGESVVPGAGAFLFETTIQAVMKRLSEQGEKWLPLGKRRDSGFVQVFRAFTSKGEGEGLECLLPMWDGSSAAVDRVHEDSYYWRFTPGHSWWYPAGVFVRSSPILTMRRDCKLGSLLYQSAIS